MLSLAAVDLAQTENFAAWRAPDDS